MPQLNQCSRRRVLQAAGASTLVWVSGCVGSFTSNTGEQGPDGQRSGLLGEPAQRAEVEIMSAPRPDIDPGIVHIEPGGTVTWLAQGRRNSVASYHPDTHREQRIPDGAEPWRKEWLREGDTFEVTLDQEGVYDYADPTAFCSTHEAIGVVGRIVVGWPTLTDQPALQHDSSQLPSRAATLMEEYNDRCREMLDH